MRCAGSHVIQIDQTSHVSKRTLAIWLPRAVGMCYLQSESNPTRCKMSYPCAVYPDEVDYFVESLRKFQVADIGSERYYSSGDRWSCSLE